MSRFKHSLRYMMCLARTFLHSSRNHLTSILQIILKKNLFELNQVTSADCFPSIIIQVFIYNNFNKH